MSISGYRESLQQNVARRITENFKNHFPDAFYLPYKENILHENKRFVP